MEKVSGIYRIVCKANGDYYYGSAKNIHSRWMCHKRTLRNSSHHNLRVQNNWNKYGEPTFRIELTEIVSVDKLLETEDKYLKKHVGKPHCMNISSDAYCPTRGRPSKTKGKKIHSDATKAHWSKIRTGQYTGPDNPFYGKHHSVEARQKMSKATKGRQFSDETLEKLSTNACKFWLGKHLSEEAKQKLSIANTGRPSPRKGVKLSDETKKKISESLKRYNSTLT